VTEYALWVHESEALAIAELERRGLVLDTSTRAMAMMLDELVVARPRVEPAPGGWDDYVRFLERSGAPRGLLAGVEGGVFHVQLAELGGEVVTGAIAYDHDRDGGIYNVGTLPHARRRGLGSAVTVLHLHEARERGCTTASLQATRMAERLYAALGFRDLGRFLEYVPGRV
jgi:ribosomal protein S18 acetylase RimI-like enzyme